VYLGTHRALKAHMLGTHILAITHMDRFRVESSKRIGGY
jgi:hypothetical protein